MGLYDCTYLYVIHKNIKDRIEQYHYYTYYNTFLAVRTIKLENVCLSLNDYTPKFIRAHEDAI